MPRKLTLEEVKQEFIDRNLIPLFEEYNNAQEKLLAQTQEGYRVVIRLGDLRLGIIGLFSKSNPYTIYNIKLWCKLNNKLFELLKDQEYKGCFKKLKFQCLKSECGEIFERNWANILHGQSCHYCTGIKVGLSNCLATKNPKLASEWHSTLNGDLTPYNVTCGSKQKVWWKCEKGHEWNAIIGSRNSGIGCPYCSHNYPTEDYNLLVCNPELCKEWDYKKNDKLPEEYCPNSGDKVWWICKECKNNWKAKISSRNSNKYGCPLCNKSKGEKECARVFEYNNFIKITQEEYNLLNDIDKKLNSYYIPQKTYDELIGLKNGLLSYDFYLPYYNLLIEYQGIQHEKYIPGFHKSKDDFKQQQEHDMRKKEYAQNNNINLLEIWYWNYENIENILNNYLSKLK